MTATISSGRCLIHLFVFYIAVICCGCGSMKEHPGRRSAPVLSMSDSDSLKLKIDKGDSDPIEKSRPHDSGNSLEPNDGNDSGLNFQNYSVVPGIPMDGPFNSVSSFCEVMSSANQIYCTNEKRNWVMKHGAGKRKDILKVQTALLLTESKDSKDKEFLCAVLLQTDRGWWASVDDGTCERSSDDGYNPVRSTLEQLRYADELGNGVLLAERQREAPHEVTVLLDGKEYVGTTQGVVLERKYCSVQSDHPHCTEWMRTSFNQENAFVKHHGGEVLIDGNIKNSNAIVRQGRYRLFKDERMIPFSAPSDFWSDSPVYIETDDAIVAESLFGPYDSMRHYCDAPPSFDDLQIEWEEETKNGRHECPVSKSKWNASFSDADGAISNFKLFTRQGDLAGAPIAYCEIAIQTRGTWFMTHSAEHCQGVVGPGASVSRQLLDVKIVRSGDLQLLQLIYENKVTRIEYGMPRSHDMDSRAQTFDDKQLLVRFCSVGESGIPACTKEIHLGCRSSMKNTASPLFRLASDMLILTERENRPGDCENMEEPPSGAFQLVFP